MDHNNWSLRAGATVILCAFVLRLGAGGFFDPVAKFFSQPHILSLMIYLETGRIVRFSDSQGDATVFVPIVQDVILPAQTDPPTEPEEDPVIPVFSVSDGASVDIQGVEIAADPAALLARPLQWDLTGEEPTVLIYHSHATESFTPSAGENYQESSPFRTLSEDYNMVSVGDRVAALLEAGGIRVIHDRQLHDHPSYNDSYINSRESVQQYLEQYPSIRLILDLHRDASGDNSNQFATSATVDGEKSAQLMLVVAAGTDARPVPNWQDNLALGMKLHVQMERIAPGVCRYVNLRSSRFNQDLCGAALLVEVGAAGNTHREAMKAVEVLAEGILALANGANVE